MSKVINDLVGDVVASPLGEVIAAVGEGVAEAQQALDEGSLAKTLEIYSEGGEDAVAFLREIGYKPTFYTLPETTGEVRVSLHLGTSAQGSGAVATSKSIQPVVATQLARIGRNVGIKPRLYATPVDAGYANRYGYQADVSAKLTFKIVPVPPPDGIDELRVTPNLVGKSLADSRLIAESLGFELTIYDKNGEVATTPAATAIVQKQDPTGQQLARLGDQIRLTLK